MSTWIKSIITKTIQISNAEPPKARRRVDPEILRARESRRKRRIEKEIKRLEKFSKKLKPIPELEPDYKLQKEQDQRKRQLEKITNEERNETLKLEREWSHYKREQHEEQQRQIKNALKSQEIALNELKKDNLALYEMAIQVDSKLIPFKRDGPSYSCAKSNYDPLEGDYSDITFLYNKRI